MKELGIGVLSVLGVFLSPVFPLILLVGFFIVCDTVFGMFTAYKLKKDITSRKLSRIIAKILIYTTSILLVYGLDKLVFAEFIESEMLITKLGAGTLCFIELFSIDENIRKINKDKGIMHYITKLFDTVKDVKNKFNSSLNG